MKKLTDWINWFWVKENIAKPFGAVAIVLALSFVVGVLSAAATILFKLGWGLLL